MAIDKEEIRCGKCIWFQEMSGGVGGECRFSAPQIVVLDGSPVTLWPTTTAGDWCGDFAKPAEEDDTCEEF